jgi:class 3 adenylate cyclase
MYAKYIPNMCRERFAMDAAELKEAELEKFTGVVAFVDISGFTKLSEYLVKKHGGDSAAELLNKFISGYFEKLVEVVVLHGGDIIKFAGDAMLVVWRNKAKSLANVITPANLPPLPAKLAMVRLHDH